MDSYKQALSVNFELETSGGLQTALPFPIAPPVNAKMLVSKL